MNQPNPQRGGMIVAFSINVMKITRERLVTGKDGAKYLNCVAYIDNEKGQFQDNGMIVESVSKEERLAGVRGPILGNNRIISGEVASQSYGSGMAQQMRPPVSRAEPVNRGATNHYRDERGNFADTDDIGF